MTAPPDLLGGRENRNLRSSPSGRTEEEELLYVGEERRLAVKRRAPFSRPAEPSLSREAYWPQYL